MYKEDFSEVADKSSDVVSVLAKEEKVFRQTLRRGLVELKKVAQKNNGLVHGADVFYSL